MWKKAKISDQTAAGQAGIRKKSKVPGVMITQFIEEIPEGKTTPDFTRKPIGLTIQEGKHAIFKSKIVGDPTPTVTWARANEEIVFHPDLCVAKYSEETQEYTLEFPSVALEDADTYKCFAANEYGRAVCTVQLNIIQVGFHKQRELKGQEEPIEYKSLLKKRNDDGTRETQPMESAEKVWEILLSAEKKDYEKICGEYGLTDFRGMLKRLTEMKREREEEVAQFISHISTLKPIDVKDDDSATIELDMDLKDPNSRIFLYKDGVMVPLSSLDDDDASKHGLKKVGNKYVFSIKKLSAEDAGLYSIDVEGVNVFSTEFKVPQVDFAVKIQEVHAEEREDANFQCVLSAPMNEIKWSFKNATLSNDEKYEITTSEDKLIHKLLVKDCMPLDAGIYAAIAGIKSSSAWLVVEADKDPANKGKKKARKTTMAGACNEADLEKIAKEQNEKYQKEMEEKRAAALIAQAEKEAADAVARAEAEVASKAAAAARATNMADAKSKKEVDAAAAKKAKSAAAAADAADAAAAKKAKSDAAAAAKAAKGAGKGAGGAGEGAGKGAGGAGEGAGKGAGGAGEGAGGAGGEGGAKGAREAKGAKGEAGAGGAKGTGAAGGAGGAGGGGGAGGAGGGEGGAGGAGGGEGGAGGAGGEGAGGAGGAAGEGGAGGAGGAGGGGGAGGAGGGGGAGGAGEGGGDVEEYEELTDDEAEKAVAEGEGKEKKEGEGDAAPAATGEGGEGAEPAEKKKIRRKKVKPVVEEPVVDPGVHFNAILSDCKANIGETAELECKLSREDCEGVWSKNGEEIQSSEDIIISKEGCFQRLNIQNITEEHAGTYRFEVDGRKSEAAIVVEDPPKFDAEDLEEFKKPVLVKKGQRATFKMSYGGREPIKVQWYIDGEELAEESKITIENTDGCSRLMLNKLQRKDSGEVKFKLKNEFGTVEVFSELIVLDKPTPPTGPLEIVEGSSNAVEIKWKPPKDSGGCKIDNYVLERNQVGRNTWKKVGPIGPVANYRDTDVDHGRRYCYRIKVETEMGDSELFETEDVQAGTKAYPGAPTLPKVVSAFKNCINLAWNPPSNTGGTNILGYNLEKRKKGSNLWGSVNPSGEMIKEKECGVKDVNEGMEYEFRVAAINGSGAGEFSTPSEFAFARDPKNPPGTVIDLKVIDSTYTTLTLSWTKPKEEPKVHDEAKGYFVEIRPAEDPEWERSNVNAVIMTTLTVKGLKSLNMYWVRVVAANEGGEGPPQELDNYILAMPPPVRPRFTETNIKSFMVVKAGNSARFMINFEASPWPDVIWLKDALPVSKKVTISNADGASQLLIPSAERTDSGIYTIIIKNIVGQDTNSIEIRVTDEPKPPGPVDMDENVPGTVTVSWAPSPDEKRDDRLHYMVTKRDSTKRIWHTVGDRIFNNKFTACNIMPGRDYQFRVYAKNDMGNSKPSESGKWSIPSKKEKFKLNIPESKTCNLERPPKFLVALKTHTAPQGYECYMSCAIRGDPTPHVTWLRNNISLNTNTNYLISNTCGVCSLLILRVGPKDIGEYTVVAENTLGRVECSTKLAVRD